MRAPDTTAPAWRLRPVQADDPEIAACVAVVNAVRPDEPTSVEQVRWGDATYPGGARFLVELDGRVVATASTGRIYMYPADHPDLWLGIDVLPEARRRGIGSALYRALSDAARDRGKHGFQTDVTADQTDGLAFLASHGFTEIERMATVRLDLTGLAAPATEPPAGVTITTLAQRPELVTEVYTVAVASFPDIPSGEPMAVGSFDEFRARDVDRPGMPADGFFLAVDEGIDEVVGYASLLLLPAPSQVAWHDMTAVLPSSRGRGIAGALKRASIAWAIGAGLTALETGNDLANAPMRAVNARLGYRPRPDLIGFKGPLAPIDGPSAIVSP